MEPKHFYTIITLLCICECRYGYFEDTSNEKEIPTTEVEMVPKGNNSKEYTIDCPEETIIFSIGRTSEYTNYITYKYFIPGYNNYKINNYTHISAIVVDDIKRVKLVVKNVSYGMCGVYEMICKSSKSHLDKILQIIIGVYGKKNCKRFYRGESIKRHVYCDINVSENVKVTDIKNAEHSAKHHKVIWHEYKIENGNKNIDIYSMIRPHIPTTWKINLGLDMYSDFVNTTLIV